MSTPTLTTAFTSIPEDAWRDNTAGYYLEGLYEVSQLADGQQTLAVTMQLHTPKPTVGYYYMVWAQWNEASNDLMTGWACTQQYESLVLEQMATEELATLSAYTDLAEADLVNSADYPDPALANAELDPADSIWSL